MTDDDTDGSLTETVSFKLSERLNAQIEADLDTPHSKSEWIREACRQQLADEQTQEPAAPASE